MVHTTEENNEHCGKKYSRIKVKEKIVLRTQRKNKPRKSVFYRNQNQFRKLAFPL